MKTDLCRNDELPGVGHAAAQRVLFKYSSRNIDSPDSEPVSGQGIRLGSERYAVLGFTVAVILALFVAVSSWRGISRLETNAQWVAHTQEVKGALTAVNVLITDAQTGLRGYLLSGNPVFLDPYRAAEPALPDQLQRLRILVADDPEQTQRLAELTQAIEQRLQFIAYQIQLFQAGKESEARAITTSGQGKRLHDALRRQVQDMMAAENALLQKQLAATEHSSQWAYGSVLAGSLLLLAVAAAALASVRGDFGIVRRVQTLLEAQVAERTAALRQSEDALRRLNAELEHRVTERTAELQEANREMEAFTYVVSHNLRSPLRGMQGFSQFLLKRYGDRLDETGRDYLNEIDLAGKEMSELIEGLLILSRSTRGELVPGWVDLSVLAKDIREELTRLAPERQVAWQIEPGMKACGDPRLLGVVMQNLLENAWKYTGATAEPRIRVYSEEAEGRRWFCVADNGAGFDMEFAEQLFKPFERLHKEEEFPGVGVGLATVLRIVRRHGGSIEASAAPGQGATFRFTLGFGPGQREVNSCR